jgi:hypothetical protein
MHRFIYSRMLAAVLLCCVVICAVAQTPDDLKIDSVRLNPILTGSDVFINVRFSARLDVSHSEDLLGSNVSIKSLPSNTPLAGSVNRVGGTARMLQINLGPPPLPVAAHDTEVEVCFTTLNFISSSGETAATTSRVCGTGLILSLTNVAAEFDKQFEVLSKTEMAPDDCKFCASGFAANGEGGDAEGGAEITFNSPDLGVRGLTAFMRLKKATAESADPKHLEIGVNQSTTSLLGRGSLADIRRFRAIMLDSTKSDDERAKAARDYRDLLRKRQNRLLSGVFFDLGGKIETEALTFDVTNVVGEGAFQIQSRTKRLFGSNRGFWRFRLMPAAFELGYNVSQQPPAGSEAAAIDPDWLARFKLGGVFTLFYKNNSEGPALFRRIQLDVQAVDRYLFRREVQFDKDTMANTSTDRGHKPWLQADFKVFFTDPEEGSGGLRTGFKLSYIRGSLPPVFADTKSFQFGFVLESTETKK